MPTLRNDEKVPFAPTPVGLRRRQTYSSIEYEDRGFTGVLVLGKGGSGGQCDNGVPKELPGPPRIVQAARPLVDSRARRICSRAAALRLGVPMRLLVSLVRREGASSAAPRK